MSRIQPLLRETSRVTIQRALSVSPLYARRRSKAYGMEQSITVRITSNTPRTFHPGALAYAEPYAEQFKGIQIRVFFDQIENSGTSKLVPYQHIQDSTFWRCWRIHTGSQRVWHSLLTASGQDMCVGRRNNKPPAIHLQRT